VGTNEQTSTTYPDLGKELHEQRKEMFHKRDGNVNKGQKGGIKVSGDCDGGGRPTKKKTTPQKKPTKTGGGGGRGGGGGGGGGG